MEVTLQDIANELDVSAATVSRSLRHDTLINPETRARVNEAAHRLGYKTRVRRPRRAVEPEAGNLTLGLLLRHSSLDAARHDVNLMKMMTGIMAATDANQLSLQVHTVALEKRGHMATDPSAVPSMVQQGTCQAFIVHGAQDERDLAFLAERAPVVSVGRIYRALPIDAAVGDNVEGVRAVVAHLVEMGHQKLAWVGSGVTATFMEARQAGFIQGCLGYGLEVTPRFFYGPDLLKEANIHAPDGLLAALGSGVTAFVCGNDNVASQVIEVLKAVGRRVPDDVSVTGFDATMNSNFPYRLTSVDPHFFEIGQLATQLAIQRITHPLSHPCIMSVRGEVVVGDTTASLQ